MLVTISFYQIHNATEEAAEEEIQEAKKMKKEREAQGMVSTHCIGLKWLTTI